MTEQKIIKLNNRVYVANNIAEALLAETLKSEYIKDINKMILDVITKNVDTITKNAEHKYNEEAGFM